METAVQIFQVKEAEALSVPEVTEQWKAMIDDLGLEGQKQLLTREDEETVASPVPYVAINKRLHNVLKTLCPKAVPIDKYSQMPIPLEILGHVKQAEIKGWFEKIEVWSDEREPDPVVVGVVRKDEEFLIGRWGAEAQTFDQLNERAVKRLTAEKKTAVEHKIADLQKAIEPGRFEANIERCLNNDYNDLSYI